MFDFQDNEILPNTQGILNSSLPGKVPIYGC